MLAYVTCTCGRFELALEKDSLAGLCLASVGDLEELHFTLFSRVFEVFELFWSKSVVLNPQDGTSERRGAGFRDRTSKSRKNTAQEPPDWLDTE